MIWWEDNFPWPWCVFLLALSKVVWGGFWFFTFDILIFSKKILYKKRSSILCDGSWACFSVGFTAGLQQRNVAITTCGVSQARAPWDLLLYTMLKGIIIQGCWHFYMLNLTSRDLFPWRVYEIWWAGRKESSEGFRILRFSPGSGTWAPFGGVLSIVAVQHPCVCVLIFSPRKTARLRFHLHSLFGGCFS